MCPGKFCTRRHIIYGSDARRTYICLYMYIYRPRRKSEPLPKARLTAPLLIASATRTRTFPNAWPRKHGHVLVLGSPAALHPLEEHRELNAFRSTVDEGAQIELVHQNGLRHGCLSMIANSHLHYFSTMKSKMASGRFSGEAFFGDHWK